MNMKTIAAIAALLVCLTAVGCMEITEESDADTDVTYPLSTDTVTVGSSYSKAISGPGLIGINYYTITGASWLSLTTASTILATGTPTTTGTYNVTVHGPIAQGGGEADWTWTINVVNTTTYAVNVHGQNGAVFASSTVNPGSAYTLPALSDTSTHRFLGYYTAASGGTYIGTAGTTITINSDREIYTHWAVKTYYQVTLDLNGYYFHPNGTLYMEDYSEEMLSGEIYSLSKLNSQINSGFIYSKATDQLVNPTFIGWSTSPTGSIVSYTSFTVNSTVTYYAIWGSSQNEDLSFLGGTNSVIAVSGDLYSYTPATNIDAAQISYTKTVPWLTFSNGTLSGTFPTISSLATYEVILTATSSNPTQTVTQSITFYVYPDLVYINEPRTSMFMGESYDFDLSTDLSGVVYTLSGVDWLTVSNDHIVGSAPVKDSTYTVTFTITAKHTASGQTDTKSVTLTVNEILEFTTLPTASFVAAQTEGVPQYESFILDYLDGLFQSASAAAPADYFFTGNTVKFVFTGTNAENLKWYVDDVLVSEDWTLTYVFENGIHKVSCIAENELGTSEEFSATISVDQGYMGLTVIDYMIILVFALLIVLVLIRLRKKNKLHIGRKWRHY